MYSPLEDELDLEALNNRANFLERVRRLKLYKWASPETLLDEETVEVVTGCGPFMLSASHPQLNKLVVNIESENPFVRWRKRDVRNYLNNLKTMEEGL